MSHFVAPPLVLLSTLTLSVPTPNTPSSTPAPSTPSSRASPAGVVDDTGSAWVVLHAGQPWVCWSPAPDCWRRIELDPGRSDPAEDLLDDALEDVLDDPLDDELGFVIDELSSGGSPQQWRFGFTHGARSLWIELDDQRWRLERGHQRARSLQADELAPIRLIRPRAIDCGPAGSRPAVVGGRLGWASAPRCQPPPPAATCVGTSATPRPRKGVPVRLRAGIELAAIRGWSARDTAPESGPVTQFVPRAGVELTFVVELGFDPVGVAHSRRARALLLQGRTRIRQLPAVPEGPLAAAEQRAHAAVLCGGAS